MWVLPPRPARRGTLDTMVPAAALHVVLVHAEIPWNTGNVGRTCLAFGARLHLVRPLGFALTTRELRRAGLDYWDRVEPVVWPAWEALEEALPSLGEPFLFSPEGETTLWDTAFPARTVLIFGRESAGLPEAVRRSRPRSLRRIPMADPALRSLNLSTAVAVALAEASRQRGAAATPR